MSETNPASSSVPTVQNRAPKPPGILPRNAQAWVIGGIALLMVSVIALSGRNQPKGRKDSTPAVPTVVDPSAARIQEYRARIEEQARKLAAEQAQLAQTKQTLGPTSSTSAAAAAVPFGNQTYPAQPPLTYQPYPPPSRERSWVESEKEKRNYQSLFASNVALSYRKDAQNTGPEPLAAPAPDDIPKGPPLYGFPYPVPTLIPTGQAEPRSPQFAPTQPTAQGKRPEDDPAAASGENREPGARAERGQRTEKAATQEPYDDLNRAEGKKYRLFEGTVIETVLTNRLDGSFSGPVNCMATTNVYSHDRQRLLIPQGSRVLGKVRRVETFGQQRLAVVFHRLIMPDGYSVSLDKLQGLNQIGETGLRDQVNHHYMQVFGVSLAIGTLAGLSQANTRYGVDTSATDAYRQGVATSLSQSPLNILDRYLNVLPTFTIREGHRIKVYLTDDLLLPAYEKHQMPSDL
jgi:type IV secretory pathway VirB10-like protein